MWKPVPNMPGVEVSENGGVRGAGCQWKNQKGYMEVRVAGKRYKAHRLICAAFLGPCPAGKEVNHKNGVKNDNRIGNLEYVTRTGNLLHAYRTGLRVAVTPIGSKCPWAKLHERQIPIIFQLWRNGVRPTQIAKDFGVSRSAIRFILSGKTWKRALPKPEVTK